MENFSNLGKYDYKLMFRKLLKEVKHFQIIEHYVYLSEGVRAAELALKLKQNEDREARKLKMMQDQHDQRAADVALLEGYFDCDCFDPRYVSSF